MDTRLKTFEEVIRQHFEFLLSLGFEAPIFAGSNSGIRTKTATFQGTTGRVETTLTLGYMGDETISTVVQTLDCTQDIGSRTAHTAFQMRKAVALHAAAVEKLFKLPST